MTSTKNKQVLADKPGPGRPRVGTRLGPPVWVRLYPEHDRELRELAQAEVREPSNMARALIVEALAARRERKQAEESVA